MPSKKINSARSNWKVLITATIIQSFVCGTLESYGALMVPVMKFLPEDDHDKAQKAAFIGSLASGCLLFFSPITSYLADKMGTSTLGIIGGVVIFFATFVASFAEGFIMLLIFYGALLGIGSSFLFICNSIIISDRFPENNVKEFGLLGIGNGLMNAIMPHLMAYEVSNFKLNGAIRSLCIVLSPMMFLPFFWSDNNPSYETCDDYIEEREANYKDDHFYDNEYFQNKNLSDLKKDLSDNEMSFHSILTDDLKSKDDDIDVSMFSSVDRTFDYFSDGIKTDTPRVDINQVNKTIDLKKLRQSSSIVQHNGKIKNWFISNKNFNLSNSYYKYMFFKNQKRTKSYFKNCKSGAASLQMLHNEITYFDMVNTDIYNRKDTKVYRNDHWKQYENCCNNVNNKNILDDNSVRSRQPTIQNSPYIYSSSLYKSQELSERTTSYFVLDGFCMNLIRGTAAQKLLKNRSFVHVCVSMMIASVGYQVPNIHIINYSQNQLGLSENPQILLTCLGGASAIGPLVNPLFLDKLSEYISLVRIFQFFVMGYGVGMLILPLVKKFTFLMIFCILIGYFDGSFSTLIGPLMTEVVGQELSSASMGMYYGSTAISIIIAGPLAGIIYDTTGDYTKAFYIAGLFFMFGSFMLTFNMFAAKKTQGSSYLGEQND